MTKLTMTAICAAIVCSGCANRSDPPLVFGAGHTVGIAIGAGAGDTGGEFVVGYKGANVALVPVSAIQPGGDEEFIGAVSGRGRDTYSVLGQFEVDAIQKKPGAEAGLGKFFATGIAAQNIAYGYARKLGMDRSATPACNGATGAGSQLDAKGGGPATSSVRRPQQQAPNTATGARDGGMLVFAQYDYKALAIDGSAADQSFKFTLGFKDRDVAVIPVVGRDAQGRIKQLGSANEGGGDDTYSVLGQFSSKDSAAADQTRSFLNSFFATGVASQTLSIGFKVKLCDEYQAPATSGSSAKTASN